MIKEGIDPMPDPKQIPYLLKLLDDDSLSIQKTIAKELTAFGPSLKEEVFRIRPTLNRKQKELLLNILDVYNRELLKRSWSTWFEVKGDKEKLEAAFHLLAEFQCGLKLDVSLKTLLDELAQEYQATKIKKDAYGLCYFLFQIKEFKGAEKDYYNSQNSNLVHVLTEKRGLPISLVCIFMLVGARCGFEIEGCNFPGHFLARIELNGKKVLVDCFNKGKILDEDEAIELNADHSEIVHDVLHVNTSAETIITRVLGNLIQAYEQVEKFENSQLMKELLNTLEFSGLRSKSR